jgi:PhnB protein
MASGTIPPGWHSVIPRIVVSDVNALAEFMREVFDARIENAPGGPTIVTIGDSKIMVSDASVRRAAPAFLYVYVADTDAAYRRALEQGATSIEAPFETPYGDRRCMVEDRWGNMWQIAVRQTTTGGG